jgi:hypothetical protein
MSQLTTEQLHEHCQCDHDRARHYGYAGQDGMCDRCYCPHFKPRTQEAAEAEAHLLNTTLEMAFNAMAPVVRKAA